MAYGMTTSRAHLNTLHMDERFRPELERLDPDQTLFNEIDWEVVKSWKSNTTPSFAGRYFLGTPTKEEIENDIGFCLWAHGEGSDPSTPNRIIPLQRANPQRQQAEGLFGQSCGAQDASAIGTYLQRCFNVGDLQPPTDSNFVLVFLEVSAGTQLSFDYWLEWATTIQAQILDPAPQSSSARQNVLLLLPAIACAFVRDDGVTYLPELPVRECLGHAAPAGQRHLCYGLWALTPLNNPAFGSFVQDPEVGPVPVYYWRSFDGPQGSPVPAEIPAAHLKTLSLITIDELAPNVDDPTKMTLVTRPWNPSAPVPPEEDPLPTGLELPSNLPTEVGVDTAAILTASQLRCIARTEIVIRRLPAGSFQHDRGHHLDEDNTLRGRPTFVARYHKPRMKGLSVVEARNISTAGMQVCSLFEISAHPLQSSNNPIRFNPNNGLRHGAMAFSSAEELGQPAYTPIYFCIDINVGSLDGTSHFPGVPSPSLAEVLQYFFDVRRAYQEYISAEGRNPTPYYIGAYGSAKVLNAVYLAGLATHFWQLWAPTFGPAEKPEDESINSWHHIWWLTATGWRAWPHLNAWQIILEVQNTQGSTLPLWDDNTVQSCMPGPERGLDLNVAWGDPGGWTIYP